MAQEGKRTRKRPSRSVRGSIQNGGFEDRLAGWGSSGAAAVSADDGYLVHSGTHAAMLAGISAFIAQTVTASRGSRAQFIAHLRGVADQKNGPVVLRLRWVDISGSFIGTALEIFIPYRQLSCTSWLTVWDVTNQAPTGTTGLNVRVDAPQSEGDAAVVIDDIAIR